MHKNYLAVATTTTKRTCEQQLIFLGFERKFENNVLRSQFLVYGGKRIKLGLSCGQIFCVKENLQLFGSIQAVASSFSNNFGGVNKVVQDGLVNLGEGAAARANSLVINVAVKLVSKNSAMSNDNNVSALKKES